MGCVERVLGVEWVLGVVVGRFVLCDVMDVLVTSERVLDGVVFVLSDVLVDYRCMCVVHVVEVVIEEVDVVGVVYFRGFWGCCDV